MPVWYKVLKDTWCHEHKKQIGDEWNDGAAKSVDIFDVFFSQRFLSSSLRRPTQKFSESVDFVFDSDTETETENRGFFHASSFERRNRFEKWDRIFLLKTLEV